MDRNDYLAATNNPGAFQRAEWVSVVKPAAAHKEVQLLKRTVATIRTGVDFANLEVNADRETGSLPWGEWQVFPYLIAHKGGEYARLYVLDGTVRTRYFADGLEVDKTTFGQYLTPSARKASRPIGGTVTVKLENLTLV